MADIYKTVYHKGNYVPFEQATLSIASAPVLYGLAVYTVINICKGSKGKLYGFRLADHYTRLKNSAQIMGFEPLENHLSFKQFEALIDELIVSNNINDDSLVRCCYYIDETLAGARMHGLKTAFSAFIYEYSQLLPASGAKACVSSWTRTSDAAIPSRAKVNGSYANSALLKNEALLNGYDEAIATDGHGHVTEGSVMNLFLVRDGVLITPDASTDILEGITRDSLLKLAGSLQMKHVERQVDRSELYIADEVFFCGSSASITPVINIDGRKISNGKIGPLTVKLQKEFATLQQGKNPAFSSWLTVLADRP